MQRLTRRFIIKSLDGIPTNEPIRYERYYINDALRIQKKNNRFEKEILNEENEIIEKVEIEEIEFQQLTKRAVSEIIRDSYLYLNDERVSIKKYYGMYETLYRVEVKFTSLEEMKNYQKEKWMLAEITDSPLAFDKYLSKLSKKEFQLELEKYLRIGGDNHE